MDRKAWMLWSLCVFLAVSTVGALGCGAPARSEDTPTTAGPAPGPELEAVRAATERFRDVNVALKEGYLRDPFEHCFVSTFEGYPRQMGAMGIHYFRPDLLGITDTALPLKGTGTHTDFNQPGVLIYEPQADGRLELVAIENLVFADAWHASNPDRPMFLGNEYYRMIDNPVTDDVDEAHMFSPHYELHMWLYRENPAGMFAQFNPNVTCEHHAAHPPS